MALAKFGPKCDTFMHNSIKDLLIPGNEKKAACDKIESRPAVHDSDCCLTASFNLIEEPTFSKGISSFINLSVRSTSAGWRYLATENEMEPSSTAPNISWTMEGIAPERQRILRHLVYVFDSLSMIPAQSVPSKIPEKYMMISYDFTNALKNSQRLRLTSLASRNCRHPSIPTKHASKVTIMFIEDRNHDDLSSNKPFKDSV